MWMMGYNDGGELNLPDSFTGRKLRPLIPRPAATSTTSTTTTNNNNYATTNPPCLSRIHGTDLLAFNHHLGFAATVAEQSKREFNAQQVVVSSRWNPTPEQLQTLEELYRRGTRTPSADQIQHITAQLRQYGKIEGKNVFYWFQNHKARERQKRRRQLESVSSDECCGRDTESNERKEHAGGNRTAAGFEVEQTKSSSSSSWALPRNFTTLVPAASQKTASMQKAAAAAAAMSAAEAEATVPPECRTDGWAQFDDDERELHQRRSLLFEGNATWHMMQLSSPSSSPPANPNTTTSTTLSTNSTPSQSLRTMDQIFMIKNSQDLNNAGGGDDRGGEEGGGRGGGASDHTLQLFPLRSGGDGDEKEKMNTGLTPYQFFEFLPLKN